MKLEDLAARVHPQQSTPQKNAVKYLLGGGNPGNGHGVFGGSGEKPW